MNQNVRAGGFSPRCICNIRVMRKKRAGTSPAASSTFQPKLLTGHNFYLGAALGALLVFGGPLGQRSAMADPAIINTTPTNLNLTNIGTVFNNRPRSATGGDIVAGPSDSAGVDVQVRLQVGQTLPFVGFVPIGSPFFSNGDITVDVGNVTATFAGQEGINAINGSGDITIDAGNIISDSTGVNAEVRGTGGTYSLFADGDIAINVGTVTSNAGNGINAATGIGNIGVTSSDISAAGFGVNAETDVGTVAVTTGDILASGGYGVNATSGSTFDLNNFDDFELGDLIGGGVTVAVGDVNASGYGINAELAGATILGVDLPGVGNVDVAAGDVTSATGFGINATTGLGTVAVTAGDVSAENGFGVNATTLFGFATVDVGDVTAQRQAINAQVLGATGVPVLGDIPGVGVASVNAGDVTSNGGGGVNATVGIGAALVTVGDVQSVDVGINAVADTGLAFVYTTGVETTGTAATGINAEAGGVAIAVANGAVSTQGDNALGVNVVATPIDDIGPISDLIADLDLGGLGLPIDVGSLLSAASGGVALAVVDDVTTTGANSTGVNAEALEGVAAVVALGTVETQAAGANGIQAFGDQFAAVIANDVVAGGAGVIATATSGPAVAVADTVLSAGAGITATADDDFVAAAARSVETTGDDADGIHATIRDGDGYILAGSVTTAGDNSTGIWGETADGSIYIVAGDVSTSGDGSIGIVNIADGTSFTLFGNVHTTGDSSPGVTSFDPSSDVIIVGASVHTEGESSAGVAGVSILDDVTIVVGSVLTEGGDSDGISGGSVDGDVTIVNQLTSTEGFGSDGITADAGGDAVVIAGEVYTDGGFAHAISATAIGDATVIGLTVDTDGFNSAGVTATAGGDATVIVDSVTTAGAFSDGITATTTTGDAIVVNRLTSTEGFGSDGITAQAGGDAFAIAGEVYTDGAFANAITASAIDGSAIVIADVADTDGVGSQAINAQSANGFAAVVVGSRAQGGSGANGAGVVFNGEDGAALVNLGWISSLNDRAIVNYESDSFTANFGGVVGYVDLGDGADTFGNFAGSDFQARGDSDFGAGDDLFYNAGLVTMALRAGPESVTFANLETFDNDGGAIWLANSIVGDRLSVPETTFVGGGFYVLDAHLGGPGSIADVLDLSGGTVVASGDGEATRLFVFDTNGGPGGYVPGGIEVVDVTGGTTQLGDFELAGGPINKGFFTYNLALRPDDVWVLESAPTAAVYQLPSLITGAQSIWHTTTGLWLDRQVDLRSYLMNPVAITPATTIVSKETGLVTKAPVLGTPSVTPGVWGKALGSWGARDANQSYVGLNSIYNYDTGYDQDTYGFIAGADFGKTTAETTWIVGVLGGYINSKMSFNGGGTTADYTGGTVGAYVTYLNNGFFIDGLLKADFLSLDYGVPALGGIGYAGESTDVTNLGFVVDTGYRFAVSETSWFEPVATLSYVNTQIDNLDEIPGAAVRFEDGDSLRAAIGARVGGRIYDAAAYWVEASATGRFWYEFEANNQAWLLNSGSDFAAYDNFDGGFGEIIASLNIFGKENGWSSFVNGSYLFNGDYNNGSAKVGVRYQW
ncbi:outer membrane autotransporter protein [Ancylobacter aquaticus]|uniref:Outer membrane autotransporter protein n=1 Tax=Ancylobacter aquaticus TaxID=100 RepID=A0A4R1H4Z0_ANCAQ|nr:autotransporter outer membrane beta-barrel domain-containing protein [Ancylobacter aquaticus]TCK16757.1 outer membrane autotransporter protein [Ancylobacter aquaticus]